MDAQTGRSRRPADGRDPVQHPPYGRSSASSARSTYSITPGNGRRLPPVALVDVSIFTDPTAGRLWAQVSAATSGTQPAPATRRCTAVAEPDGHGGTARMRSCWCGGGCVCPTCGEQIVRIPTTSGLEWITRSTLGGRHTQRWCAPSSCTTGTVPGMEDRPACCALPMGLAPLAWVCHREIGTPPRLPVARPVPRQPVAAHLPLRLGRPDRPSAVRAARSPRCAMLVSDDDLGILEQGCGHATWGMRWHR